MIVQIVEGIFYSAVPLGLFFSFRILFFPDLSVDQNFSLATIIAAYSLNEHLSLAFGIFFLSALSLGFAALSTFLLWSQHVPKLLISIVVLSICHALSYFLYPTPNIPFSLPFPRGQVIFWLCFLILALFVVSVYLQYTLYGAKLIAVGEKPLLARELGFSVFFYYMSGFFLSYFCVSLAGFCISVFFNLGDIHFGVGLLLYGISILVLAEMVCPIKFQKLLPMFIILAAVFHNISVYKIMPFVLNNDWNVSILRTILSLMILVSYILVRPSRGQLYSQKIL